MSGFLIDTNVISEIVKPLPDTNVAAWSRVQPKQRLFLSVVSMGENTQRSHDNADWCKTHSINAIG